MNNSEVAAAITLKNAGWQIFNKGFPDFLCVDEQGNYMWVEVKKEGDSLSDRQTHVVNAMRNLGIPVYIGFPQRNGELELGLPDPEEPRRIIKVQTIKDHAWWIGLSDEEVMKRLMKDTK